MVSSSIEIVWAANWNRHQRRVARPWVIPAVSLADEALNYLDIEPRTPKRALLMRVGESYPTVGSAVDDFTMELHVSTRDIKRKRVARNFSSMALTSTHEVAHCVRSEYFEDENDPVERAATEGIAYQAEFVLAQAILTEEELGKEYGSAFVDLSPLKEESLKLKLSKDAEKAKDFASKLIPGSSNDKLEEELEKILDRWFDASPVDGVEFGDRLGIMAVGRLLGEGATFPDILQLPAQEIIGVSY